MRAKRGSAFILDHHPKVKVLFHAVGKDLAHQLVTPVLLAGRRALVFALDQEHVAAVSHELSYQCINKAARSAARSGRLRMITCSWRA